MKDALQTSTHGTLNCAHENNTTEQEAQRASGDQGSRDFYNHGSTGNVSLRFEYSMASAATSFSQYIAIFMDAGEY